MRFGVENESFDSLNCSSLFMNCELSDSLSGFDLTVERFLSLAFGFFNFFDFGVFGIDGIGCISALAFSLRYFIVIFCNLSAPFLSTIVDASICSSISSA